MNDFLSLGGTQKDIAAAAHVAPATLSRYLSGERIAPSEFITSLDAFLGEHGRPLDAQARDRLLELCGQAHAASGSPAVQLAHLKEELAYVRKKKGDREAELTALQRHTDQLAAELQQALDRARRSEKDQLALETCVADQDKRLQDAQAYTRQLQTELTALHEQVLLLQREVTVLRRQNQRLVEEGAQAPGPREEAPVSGVSTQVSDAKGQSSRSSGNTGRDGKGRKGHRKPPKKPKPGRSRPRAQAPPTDGQGTASQDLPVFHISWTGNEDPRTFSKGEVGAGGLALALAYFLFFSAQFGWGGGDPVTLYAIGGVSGTFGVIILVDPIPPNRARKLMRERALRLDSTGLTTSDSSGKQHFPWTSLKNISIQRTGDIHGRYPLALHIQLQRATAEAKRVHRPAGWPLAQDPPEVCRRPVREWSDEWVPVCVLSPLSGPAKADLQNIITVYMKSPPQGLW
ncbi:helix-turn-helix domain-containing protein [Streptomyces sp. NPDC048219]|uniref:helix-turn-helix domain-containing protein n=1 Tax=Streptomyces sp. NPDC048219 TaxID=3365517 RepID=UPI003723BB49